MTRPTIFFDCESTGIPRFERPAEHPEQPYLVSVTAWLVDEESGEEIAKPFYRIIAPSGWKIPPRATAVHGIDDARAAREGRPMPEVMAELGQLHDRAEVFVCWGAGFDEKLLRGAYRRCGMPDRYKQCLVIDLMGIAREKAGYKISLGDAIASFLDEQHEKHRDPIEDIRQLRRLAKAL